MARYLLARDMDSLVASFNFILDDPSRTWIPCAEGASVGLSKWEDHGETADYTGWMACASPDNQGTAEIVWTRNSSLFMAHADGPDFASLKQWWVSTGNKAG